MEFNNPWLNFSQLSQVSAGKKIIFWGCGSFFEKTIKAHNFNVSHLVDYAKNKQGIKSYCGYDVLDPLTLKTLKHKKQYYIIISTSAFYEVIDQLKSYGYEPGTNFSVTPLLQNFKIIDDLISHEQFIILSSSDAVKDLSKEGGGIYTLHMPSGKMEKKLSGITRGIEKFKGKYYVVDGSKGIRILDEGFKEISGLELPKRSAPHGLIIDKEKELIYVVLTQQDKICAYDLNSYKLVRTITLTDKYEKTGVYHHHMNDICLDGNSLYISMFSKTGNVQKYFYDSAIAEYDLGNNKVIGSIIDGLWQPHSVKIINNQLCFLDSMRGNLHLYPQKVETHLNGFIRGLDFDGKYYYIGQSIHRYFDRMMGYSNNISVDCGVFIFDNVSKACKFYPTATLKDINTIMLLK